MRGFNAVTQSICDNICRATISPNADFDTGLPAGVFLLAAAAAAAEAEDGM